MWYKYPPLFFFLLATLRFGRPLGDGLSSPFGRPAVHQQEYVTVSRKMYSNGFPFNGWKLMANEWLVNGFSNAFNGLANEKI